MIQLFGEKPAYPSVLVPSRLEYFSSQILNEKYTSEYFIQKHTVLPYYLPFISENKANRLIEGTKEAGGRMIFMLSGMASSNLFKKNSLYYCPLCIKEDIKTVGEPYFHRKHQLEGIMICHMHGCYLEIYKPYSEKISNAYPIKLTRDMIDNPLPKWPEKNNANWLNEIALISDAIVEASYKRLTYERIRISIRRLLDLRGYLTKNNCVRQSIFCSDLKNFYGTNLLSFLRCDFSDQHYEWPRELAKGPRHTIHPIRYILALRFLCGSFEDTKKFFLDNARTTIDYSTDLKIRKQANKKPSKISHQEREEQYLSEIKEYIRFHPQTRRKDIKELFGTQYSYLCWCNKEALYSILSNLKPSKIGRPCIIDWDKRDKECLNDLKRVYEDLKQRVPPIWLSKNRLVNSLKYKSVLLHLDRLPKTKKYLLAIAESVSDYRLRRIEYCCKKLLSEKGYIRKWELLKEASVSLEAYKKLQEKIDTIISNLI